MPAVHAYSNHLRLDDGTIVETFTSNWAACAAMLRLSEPEFRSLGGDSPIDLAKEIGLADRIAEMKGGRP